MTNGEMIANLIEGKPFHAIGNTNIMQLSAISKELISAYEIFVDRKKLSGHLALIHEYYIALVDATQFPAYVVILEFTKIRFLSPQKQIT